MNINERLMQEFNLTKEHTDNVVSLLDEGNTIPFIARYRKELTGHIDDQVLRSLVDRLNYLRNLETRKQEVEKSITEQGKFTEEIALALEKAETLTEVEDIYRPFKKKKETRAIYTGESSKVNFLCLLKISTRQKPNAANIKPFTV